ncbi:MAG TPA: hypothetical protein VF642_03555 [Propionibacteriaceae bacterium]
MVDAIQNYLALVNGLTRMTRQMAMSSARTLLSAAGLEDVANGASERVNRLAEDILVANRANRELVENLVTAEVDKAAARWGFVRNDDVAALREEVAALRQSLNRAAAPSSSAQQPPLGGEPATRKASPEHPTLVPSEPLPYEPGPIQPRGERADAVGQLSDNEAAAKTAAKRAPAKKTAAKRAPAKKAATTRTPAKKAATPGGPPNETPTKRTSAKTAPAKRTPVGETVATSAPASRADGDVAE